MTPTQRPKILGAAMLASILAISACTSTSTDSAESTAAEAELTTFEETSTATAATVENQESHFDDEDLIVDDEEIVEIVLDGASASSDSGNVTIEGGSVTITADGTYSLAGSLSDGEVVVEAGDDDDVTLILDGVDITNADGAAIAIMNADDAIVVLADDSTNSLTDGAADTFPDAETDEPNATLYSAADLTIAGDGELVVVANDNDGITSKDGLVIDGGAISVTATDDGIRGKDYVIVDGATISVDSGGDGITSDNEDDPERGYVQIASGAIDVTAGDDGIQAATDVLVTGGDLTIDAGSVSGAGRAMQGDVMVSVSGGTIEATAVDDAIHSNDAVTIDGGTITVAAGDDGIHGDLAVTINGGTITVADSFEGIEAEVITINDGVIDITSRDDGLNVASAEASVATEVVGGGRGGPGEESVGEHYVYINGGTTSITVLGELDEQGDGIDANGHIVMTGGVVEISGPTDTRNSAVDYSGGSFVMTGGSIIGTNIDGRNSEGVGIGSSQASLYITTGSVVSAGSTVEIANADGETLVTFEPANDYSVIVFSSADLVAGETYTVSLGGAVAGTVTAMA